MRDPVIQNRREMLVNKYSECLRAIDVLRRIETIDCDKLTKQIMYQLIEESDTVQNETNTMV